MKVEIKNVKTFLGNEGYGYNCSVYIDDKKVAMAIDDATGGEAFTWVDDGREDFWKAFEEMANLQPEAKEWTHIPYWSIIISEMVDQAMFKAKAKGKKVAIVDEGEFYIVEFNQKVTPKDKDKIEAYLKTKYPTAELVSWSPIIRILELPK